MSLFLFDHLDELAQRLKAAPACALFLDFDGTLVPLNENPDQVEMPASLRLILLALLSKENLVVAVVSGRQRADLQAKVGVPGLIYAGNHGLEISGPGFIFIEPNAVDYRDTLQDFVNDLTKRLQPIQGAWVEDKGLTVSVHWRKVASDQLDEVRRMVHAALEKTSHPFLLTTGDKVYEIRPRVDWNKGDAVNWIRQRHGMPHALPMYVGDDRTDEDAFASLPEGITIKVGDPTETAASYHLHCPEEVHRLLQWLADRVH